MDLCVSLFQEMVSFFVDDPRRCQHFIKVAALAKQIAIMEQADEHTVFVCEAAGYIHDCGIKPGEVKYGVGHAHGHVQEIEGPPVVEAMLPRLGFVKEDVERISYLVAHHHTYNNIQGLDYHALVEADFIVNLYEDGSSKETAAKVIANIFTTRSGIFLAKTMFGLD